jgi:CheY-like chemotaxis protein/HPt (histidine-containing phosphotransfer) domain-containing protein
MSVVIAILASYAALDLAGRIAAARGAARLAAMMDGTMGVRSQVGHRSVFWVTCRFERRQPAPQPPIEALPAQRALVVDDNATNRAILFHQLSAWDMRVRETVDGLAALETLLEAERNGEGFDLALVDAHIPIIAMTAHAMQGDREKCLLAGMDDDVPNPMKSDELAAALGRALRLGGPSLGLFVVAGLRQRAGPGESDPFPDIGRAFLEKAERRLEAARSAANDTERAAQGNALCGIAGTIGAKSLAALCVQLEHDAGGRVDTQRLLLAVEHEYRRVTAAIEIQSCQ